MAIRGSMPLLMDCHAPAFCFSLQIVIFIKVKTGLPVEIKKYRSLCAHMGEDAITADPPFRERRYQHP